MLSVLHSQYHACWCTGDFRSQCISRHGIDHQSRIIPSPASEELMMSAIATEPAVVGSTTQLCALQSSYTCTFSFTTSTSAVMLHGFELVIGTIHSGESWYIDFFSGVGPMSEHCETITSKQSVSGTSCAPHVRQLTARNKRSSWIASSDIPLIQKSWVINGLCIDTKLKMFWCKLYQWLSAKLQ